MITNDKIAQNVHEALKQLLADIEELESLRDEFNDNVEFRVAMKKLNTQKYLLESILEI